MNEQVENRSFIEVNQSLINQLLKGHLHCQKWTVKLPANLPIKTTAAAMRRDTNQGILTEGEGFVQLVSSSR